jgi:hypothetical protein
VQFYSRGTYKAIKYLVMILGCISCFVATFVAINTLFVGSFRKFPASLTTMLLVVSAYASFSYVIQTIAGFEKTVCIGHTPADQKHFACGVQGWFSITGTLCLALYWMCVSGNMYLAVARGKVITDRRVEIGVHAVCIGIPVLMGAIVFGNHKIRNNGGAALQCFIETIAPGAQKPNLGWIWGCWGWIILFCLAVGTVVLVLVILHLREITEAHVHVRILLFLGWKWLNLFFAILNTLLWDTVHTNKISADFLTYGLCRLGAANCPKGLRPNEGLIVFSVLTYTCEGLLIGLLIGSGSEMRDHWWSILARIHPSLAPAKYSISLNSNRTTHTNSDRPSKLQDSSSA